MTHSRKKAGLAVGLTLLLTLLSPLGRGAAAVPEVDPRDLPRIPGMEPAQALNSFQLKDGFRLELAAREPQIADPVAIVFDENLRMFAVEMRGYSERREENISRIRLLEDRDGDGRYESSTVFAKGLGWPTALFYYDGGLFVADVKDILYFKDTNGDGVADQRAVVYTGFGSEPARPQNVQSLMNSFLWTLDNRIHVNGSRDSGVVRRPSVPGSETDLRRRDFSFDPSTLEIRSESGGGQHGLAFDNWGRKFNVSNSSHLREVMYEARYAARNSFFAMPSPVEMIAVDGAAAEIYRISPDEPWRIVRTRMRRVTMGAAKMEGGGRISGYFTGATGVAIYRGNAWPSEFAGNAFVGEIGGNLVHRKIVYPADDGVSLRARRPDDEQKVEFLASRDNWFRPTDMVHGPDGNLYVIDMYRETIEHPWSIPEDIKKHVDLNSGNDRGRIYRVARKDFRYQAPARLGGASTAELVRYLEHPNSWQRETASRLLFEQQNPDAAPLLEELLAESSSPLGRLHALYALDGLKALKGDHVGRGLRDENPGVRRNALRLAEGFLGRPEPGAAASMLKQLLPMVDDPSPYVRYQLAFTLGEATDPRRVDALAAIVRQDGGIRWTQAAVMSSLSRDAGGLFERLLASSARNVPAAFLRELVGLIGAQNRPADIDRVLAHLAKIEAPDTAVALVAALGTGLARSGGSLAAVASRLGSLLPLAGRLAVNRDKAESLRIEAVRILGQAGGAAAETTLLGLIRPHETQAVQLEALRGLGRFGSATAADALLGKWTSLTPRLRSELMTALMGKDSWTVQLLRGVEGGKLRAAEISSTQLAFLSSHSNPTIQAGGRRLQSQAGSASRQAVIDDYRSVLELPGDAARGRQVFMDACAACHRMGAEGVALGPDMTTVRDTGKEKLLLNILDPNREVAPNYLNYRIELQDGRSLFGVIASETAGSVTLREPFGAEHGILRSEIARMESLGQSIMPEGLEAAIGKQGMADLLEYITQ